MCHVCAEYYARRNGNCSQSPVYIGFFSKYRQRYNKTWRGHHFGNDTNCEIRYTSAKTMNGLGALNPTVNFSFKVPTNVALGRRWHHAPRYSRTWQRLCGPHGRSGVFRVRRSASWSECEFSGCAPDRLRSHARGRARAVARVGRRPIVWSQRRRAFSNQGICAQGR